MPRIFPIYLFTGDDDYLKKEALEKLKKALLGNSASEAFNFNVYDITRCDIREVIDTLKSASFISGKRLVLLKSVELAKPEEEEAILKYALAPKKDSCLVLENTSKEIGRGFYKKIVKCAREISFILPKRARVTNWIQKEVAKKGKKIAYDAGLLLKELKEDDPKGLRLEIDKLITYIGKRHAISCEDVKKLVGSSASRNVFEFVDALSKRDAKGSLAIAKEMSRTKKGIGEILGMIGWHFRRIKKAKKHIEKGEGTRDISAKCNVPSFYVERFMKEIKSFTTGEIEKIIDYLLEADYGIKRGYSKPEEALELLIVKICAKRK